MSIILLTSVGGAPGVTTAAVGLAASWPRPVLLVEADLSTTTRILPGALRAQVPHESGMTELAVADFHRQLDEAALWDQAVEIAENVSLVPGFKSIRAGAHTDARFWRSLVDVLRVAEARGIDVLIDAGRLGVDDPRIELVREADSVGLFMQNTLPAIASVHAVLQPGDLVEGREPGWLRSDLDQIGHAAHLDLIVCEAPHPGNTYPAGEAAKQLGQRLLHTIPWHPKGAALYAFGVPQTPPKRNAYVRAMRALAQAYVDRLATRKSDELGEEMADE